MSLYRVLLGIDLAAAAVAVFFFLRGLSDGTVSSFNIGTWATLLGGIGAILAGGIALHRSGRTGLANLLLLLLAFPAAGYVLFFAMLLITQPRWN